MDKYNGYNVPMPSSTGQSRWCRLPFQVDKIACVRLLCDNCLFGKIESMDITNWLESDHETLHAYKAAITKQLLT